MMAEEQSTGRAIQIYVKQEDGNYKLDVEAASTILHHEEVRDNPIMIVSIAGAMRQGKSFMLNLFIKYLESGRDANWIADKNSKLKGFSWRGGSERDTLGILMWSEPFLVEGRNGEKVAILLMDTQGAFDNEHSIAQSTKIITMSMMMSSYQIYNVMQNLRVDKLGFFRLFIEYSRMTTKETTGKAFQSLLFLIRDWAHRKDHKCGSVGGKDYIKKQLTSSSVGKNKNLDKSFDTISGFLLPNPGDTVMVEREDGEVFDGAVADISTEFTDYVKELVDLVFSSGNIVKKLIGDEEMTGAKMLTLAKSVSDLLEKDDLPKPKDLVQAQIEAHCNNTVDEFTKDFCILIRESYNGKPFLDGNYLNDKCEEAKQIVMHNLEQTRIYGGDEAKEDCRARLVASIQHEEERIKSSNRNTRNEYWQKYEEFFKTESEQAETQLLETFKQCVEETKILDECKRVADELEGKLLEQNFGIPEFDTEFEEKISALERKLCKQLTSRNKTELDIAKMTCEAKEGEILSKAKISLIEELKKHICTSDKEVEDVLNRIKQENLEIWKAEINFPDFVTAQFTSTLEKKLDAMINTAIQLNDENKITFERDLSLEVSKLTKQYVNYMDQKIEKRARQLPDLKAFHEECFQKVLDDLKNTQMEPALKNACVEAIKEKLAEEYLSIEKTNEEKKKEYERNCRIKLSDNREIARNYIKEKCGKDIKTEEELSKIYNEAKGVAVQTFTTECKDSGPKDLFEKHLLQLHTELEKLLADAKDVNSDNERIAILNMAEDIKTAKHEYKAEMFKHCASEEPISDDNLLEIHQECMKQTRDDFMANKKDLPQRMQRECSDKLNATLQQAFYNVQQENARKRIEQVRKQNRIIRECMEAYDSHMVEASKGHIMTDGELEKCHEEGYQKVIDRLNRERDGMNENIFHAMKEILNPKIDDRRQDFRRDNEKRKEWAQNSMGEYMDKLKLCYEREMTEISTGRACSDEDLEIYHIKAVKAAEEKLSKMTMASGEIKEQCENEIVLASDDWKQEWQKKNKNNQEKFRNDCVNLKKQAVAEYKREMSRDETSCLNDKKLKYNQEEARRRAIEFFDRKNLRGPQEIKLEFESELKNEIEEEFNEYLEKNKENWGKKRSEATRSVEHAKEHYHDEMKKESGLSESDFRAYHKSCKRAAEEILAQTSLPQSLMDEKKSELDQSIAAMHEEFRKRNENVLERQDADIRRYIKNDCLDVYEEKMKQACEGIKTPSDLSSGDREAKDETLRKFDCYEGSFQSSRRQEYLNLLEKLCSDSKNEFIHENDRKKAKRERDIESLRKSALKTYNSEMRPKMTGVDSSELQIIHDNALRQAKEVITNNYDVDREAKTQAINELEEYLRERHAREDAEKINQTRLLEISVTTSRAVSNAYKWYTNQMTAIIRKNCCHDLSNHHATRKMEAQTKYPASQDTSKDYNQKRDQELDEAYKIIKRENEDLMENRSQKYKNLKDQHYGEYTSKASKKAKKARKKWLESRRRDYFEAKQKEITSKILKEFRSGLPPDNCPQCETCDRKYIGEITDNMNAYYKSNIGKVEEGKGSSCIIA